MLIRVCDRSNNVADGRIDRFPVQGKLLEEGIAGRCGVPLDEKTAVVRLSASRPLKWAHPRSPFVI